MYPWKALAKTHDLTSSIMFSIVGIIGLMLKWRRKPLFATFNSSLPILSPYISFSFGQTLLQKLQLSRL